MVQKTSLTPLDVNSNYQLAPQRQGFLHEADYLDPFQSRLPALF